MANKTRNREITITDEGGSFNAILRRFTGSKNYDFEGLSLLRRLLSNEKARLIHTIKKKNPGSIYELAKILNRDFKSVNDDIKLLERFGVLNMVPQRTGKRTRLKPIVVIDALHVTIKI